MRLYRSLPVAALIFWAVTPAAAAEPTIVITEIGAHESAELEWIEIYNATGASIDMTGWKFLEDGTKHKLTATRGSLIVLPGEYAIIANNASAFIDSYGAYGGAVIDSAWSSLKESGEEIGVADASSAIHEQFTYPALIAHSLQRRDLLSPDYTAANWVEHATSDSAGRANEFESPSEGPSDVPPQPIPVGDAPLPQPRTVLIYEVCPDPATGPEWIEVFNTNQFPVDLNGWTLTEGSGSVTRLEGSIAAYGYLVVKNLAGALNNGGDIIILKNSSENEFDSMAYGSWDDGNVSDNAPAAADPLTLAFDAHTGVFAVTTTPTPGAENSITITTSAVAAPASASQSSSGRTSPTRITISELFPNPPGADSEYEFIELHNEGMDGVDLAGWRLTDSERIAYEIPPNAYLPQGSYLALDRLVTGIALDNGGGTIKLYNRDEKLIDSISFTDDVPQGATLVRTGSKKLTLSATVTRAGENIVTGLPLPPVIAAACTTEDVTVTCDASDSYDANHDHLSFSWSIDGANYETPIMMHRFDTPGKKEAHLTVSDGVHETRKDIRITIDTPQEPIEPVAEEFIAFEERAIGSITTDSVSESVMVEGVITRMTKTTATLTDDSGVISIKISGTPSFSVSDRVRVFGTVRLYRGAPQIVPSLAVEVIKVDPPPGQEPTAVSEPAASPIAVPPRHERTTTLAYLASALVASLGTYGVSRGFKRRSSSSYDHTHTHSANPAVHGEFRALSRTSALAQPPRYNRAEGKKGPLHTSHEHHP